MDLENSTLDVGVHKYFTAGLLVAVYGKDTAGKRSNLKRGPTNAVGIPEGSNSPMVLKDRSEKYDMFESVESVESLWKKRRGSYGRGVRDYVDGYGSWLADDGYSSREIDAAYRLNHLAMVVRSNPC